jgi:DNA repair photolyase
MVIVEDKKKHKEAALKAWKTIRKKKREKAASKSQKITQYISPEMMRKIKHPELTGFQEIRFAWSGNRIVVPFHKTPPNIACGPFWELRWAYGCPLNCSYCYLRGTTRGKMTPQYVKIEHVLSALDEAFIKITEPSIFNAGELSDALMNPELMERIVDKFEEQDKHKIYLLTKFGMKNIKFLLDKPRKQVICGWSINAQEVAKLWERSAPTPNERIEAAKLASNAGYDTRIRIDPIFPVTNWKLKYENLLKRILASLSPSRIILGTPRGLWKTIKYAKEAGVDMSWAQFFKEDTGWGKKLAFEQRREVYQFFYDKLGEMGYPLSWVSICKETVEMWDALRSHCIPRMCNCYGKIALES